MKNNKHLYLVVGLLIIGLQALSQKTSPYRKYLSGELKSSRLFRPPLAADFNGDGKKDYAVVLRDKKHRDQITLFIIYSSADSLIKQDLGSLPDTMDFSLAICTKNKKWRINSAKIYPYNGIVTYSNEWNYLFEFDPVKKAFYKAGEEHIGP
jgi:hypothetical protein